MKRLALLVAVAALAAGCARGRLVRDGAVDQDGLAAVERSIGVIRGRPLRTPVPAVVLDGTALREMIASDIDASYPGEDIARIEAVYTQLGLLPAGTKLRSTIEQLYTAEGAAFYDPRAKRLVISTNPIETPVSLKMVGLLSGRDLAGEMIVAHELTHAIQDQYWGVPTAPDPIANAQGDCRLAYRAVLEGDATLAGFGQILGGGPDAKAIGAIERELTRLPAELAAKHPGVPPALLATLAVQYQAGAAFVGRALTNGGWPAVDALYDDPPTSTEHILHPARYFDTRDLPVVITLAGTEALERDGWSRALEDTLGETYVRVIAERTLPPDRAAAVAEGWGGDRVRALARGEQMVIVWMTAWDTPADADEWSAALPALLPDAHVARREQNVLVVLAPPEVAAGSVATMVLERTRFATGAPCRTSPAKAAGRSAQRSSPARSTATARRAIPRSFANVSILEAAASGIQRTSSSSSSRSLSRPPVRRIR